MNGFAGNQRLRELAAGGEDREIAAAVAPLEAAQSAERTCGLGGQRTTAEAAVEDFRDKLDALPADVVGSVSQIRSTHRDAQTAVNGAARVSLDTAAEVKAAGARVRASGKHRTAPREIGKGRPDSYEQLGDDLVALAGADVDPLIRQQMNAYANGTVAQIRHDADAEKMGRYFKDLKSGKLTPVIEQVLDDGYVALKESDRLVGRDLATTVEMQRAMDAVKKGLKDPDPGMFGRVLDAYTKFFKTYATATPGFHIRNALSATFMNLTEGVSFKEMLDGRTIWRTFRKNPSGDWVAKLPSPSAGERRDVVDAVYASGAGGRFSAAELAAEPSGGRRQGAVRVVDNR